MISERNILIWLNSIGVSNLKIEILRDYFTDLEDLWTAKEQRLLNSKVFNSDNIVKFLKYRNNEYLEELLFKIKQNNINVITIADCNYPAGLINIYDKPMVIYSKGEYKEEDRLAIGIVGSRKATAYGKWACERFTRELVNLGVTIVSGLALGIDTVAHKTAIECNGRTIGVLGNGIDNIYPKTNYNLYREVAENGCIFTEFPIGTEPFSYNFPQRNRIISGLSLGIVVIEAKDKSGSLITAHHALEQGKDVFALPGNINSIYSCGTNRLIKDGAKPLLDIDDIIEEIYELQLRSTEKKAEELDYSSLSEDEIKIMRIILDGPVHTDTIVLKSGLGISTVMSIITILELKGMIRELASRTFSIC